MRTVLCFALVAALVIPVTAAADTSTLGVGEVGGAFTVSVSPNNLEPYGQAVLTLTSSTLDLANATVTVTANGKKLYTGNAQPIPVPLGADGSVISVVITITASGQQYLQTIDLQPQDVALVVEPLATTPPLYPGKPLVPIDGKARLVAMANLRTAGGTAIDPTSCAYSWTVDGTQIASASGIGKDTLTVASPLEYRSRNVSVVVTSPSGTLSGRASVSLSPSDPSVLIYENDPLLGLRYGHALSGTYAIPGAEDTLYAALFSFPSLSSAPSIQWFVNGDTAQTGSSITLRPAGSGAGNADLSLIATAGDARATTQLSLSFNTASSSSSTLFGL